MLQAPKMGKVLQNPAFLSYLGCFTKSLQDIQKQSLCCFPPRRYIITFLIYTWVSYMMHSLAQVHNKKVFGFYDRLALYIYNCWFLPRLGLSQKLVCTSEDYFQKYSLVFTWIFIKQSLVSTLFFTSIERRKYRLWFLSILNQQTLV